MLGSTPFLNLVLMNRFLDGLFKSQFINEGERLKNMLIIQQNIYNEVAEIFVPEAIRIMTDKNFLNKLEGDFIPSFLFKLGNEVKLVDYLEKDQLNGISEAKRTQIK